MKNNSPEVLQTDTSTSQEAFEAVQPKLSHLHQQILSFIESRGMFGVTDAEIQHHLGVDPKMNTRTRRKELVELGLVTMAGYKRQGRTEEGKIISRSANVWVSSLFKPVRRLCSIRASAAEAAEQLARELRNYAKACRSDMPVTQTSWANFITIETMQEYHRTREALRDESYRVMTADLEQNND